MVTLDNKIGTFKRDSTVKFETNRLIIRPPCIDDAADIFKNYAQDREVTRYLTWRPHSEFSETQRWVNYCVDHADTPSSLIFVITPKDTAEVIGMIDVRLEGCKAHLGYVLAKPYWNHGVMTEAMRPVIDYVAAKPDIYRIWAAHDIDNDASGRVMLKLGMRYEGVVSATLRHPNISDQPRDGKYYSLDCVSLNSAH